MHLQNNHFLLENSVLPREWFRQIDQAVALLRKHFKNQPVVTVIDFKELLDISRKHAVELLEYFDSQHLTIRQENQRVPARIMEA